MRVAPSVAQLPFKLWAARSKARASERISASCRAVSRGGVSSRNIPINSVTIVDDGHLILCFLQGKFEESGDVALVLDDQDSRPQAISCHSAHQDTPRLL